MKKDQLTIWTPIEAFPKDLLVEKLIEDYDGLKIYLKGSGKDAKTLKVFFEARLCYQMTDESWLWRRWDEMSRELLGKTFYTVENSNYVTLFHENTFEAYLDWKITHYGIYTIEDCIDILSCNPPIFEWLN